VNISGRCGWTHRQPENRNSPPFPSAAFGGHRCNRSPLTDRFRRPTVSHKALRCSFNRLPSEEPERRVPAPVLIVAQQPRIPSAQPNELVVFGCRGGPTLHRQAHIGPSSVHGHAILVDTATDNSQAIVKDKQVSQRPVGAILMNAEQTALIHLVVTSRRDCRSHIPSRPSVFGVGLSIEATG